MQMSQSPHPPPTQCYEANFSALRPIPALTDANIRPPLGTPSCKIYLNISNKSYQPISGLTGNILEKMMRTPKACEGVYY